MIKYKVCEDCNKKRRFSIISNFPRDGVDLWRCSKGHSFERAVISRVTYDDTFRSIWVDEIADGINSVNSFSGYITPSNAWTSGTWLGIDRSTTPTITTSAVIDSSPVGSDYISYWFNPARIE